MSDFLVVGAGVMGLLLSRKLAATGASVTLLEKNDAGQEASWAGGGIVSPLYPWLYPESITVLTRNAQESYRRLSEELLESTGIDPEYNPSGLLMLDRQDSDEALQWAADNEKPMEELDAGEIERREPRVARKFHEGLFMPYVGNIRNPRLLRALVSDIRKNNSRIEFIENAGECVPKLSTSGTASVVCALGEKQASQIVFTTGAWTGPLLEGIGKKNNIHPVLGQMMVFEPGPQLIRSIVLYNGRYLIPRRDGRILIGSTLENTGFDKRITEQAKASLLSSALEIAPGLEKRKLEKQWSGLRPGSSSGVPVMGRFPDSGNLYFCAGHFRNGLVLAPASTDFMLELLLEGETTIDPLPYSLS